MTNSFLIGIHGNDNLEGGRYNVLSSFTLGLLNAFNDIGMNAMPTYKCVELKQMPNITIGFNVSSYHAWDSFLGLNIPHIMWVVDSPFLQNTEVIKKYSNNRLFTLFNITSCDNAPMSMFFYNLKNIYMPHAVDLNFWKSQNEPKTRDVVIFSSLGDYEKRIEKLKETTNQATFDYCMCFVEEAINNPQKSYWKLYNEFSKQYGVEFENVNTYAGFYREIMQIVMDYKKAKLAQNLDGINIEVYGEGPWERYLKDKSQYKGPCDIKKSIEIMRSAKILIHPHPRHLNGGLHERVLNANAVGTFVLSSEAPIIEKEFQDSVDFYNSVDFSDLKDKINLYLQDEDLRKEKNNKAYEIIKENHTWHNRARKIASMLGK